MTFPEMDITKFTLKMQADWARFVAETAVITDAQGLPPRLRKALGVEKAGFENLNNLPGGKASKFSVNVQDPTGPVRLQNVEAGLIKHCNLVGRPVLDAWEVSLDAIPKKGAGVTRRQAAEMAAFLFLTCAYRFPEGYSIRVYGENGAKAVPSTFEQLVRALEGGYSAAIGNQRHDRRGRVSATPIALRAYLKERDNGEDLQDGKFFARIESTCQGEAFPFRHPEDLNDFDFAEWNRQNGLFNFRLPDVAEWNPYAQATLDLAIPQRFATINEGRRKNKHGTKANTPLNRKVKDAAVALTNRWAKHPVCRNSTIFESENRSTMRDEGCFTNNYPFNVNNPSNKSVVSNPLPTNNTEEIHLLPDNEEQSFLKILGDSQTNEQPLTLDSLFNEFFNFPETEEDQRIAKLFDDLLSEPSFVSPLPERSQEFPFQRLYGFTDNRLGIEVSFLPSFGKVRGADRLHSAQLIDLFPAQPP